MQHITSSKNPSLTVRKIERIKKYAHIQENLHGVIVANDLDRDFLMIVFTCF